MKPGRRSTRLFVDAIDDGIARVLLGERVLSIAVDLLPAAVREGEWVELSVGVVPPPDSDTDETRERLAKDDPGGTIKL